MLKAWGMKDIGKCREINQDYISVSEEPIGNLPNLFLVADGMGGHKAGDLASEYTVAKVQEAVSKSMQTIPYQILKGAFQYANQKLLEKAGESDSYTGMGTTLVAATVKNDAVYVVNVGDSRLYKIGDKIEQIRGSFPGRRNGPHGRDFKGTGTKSSRQKYYYESNGRVGHGGAGLFRHRSSKGRMPSDVLGRFDKHGQRPADQRDRGAAHGSGILCEGAYKSSQPERRKR